MPNATRWSISRSRLLVQFSWALAACCLGGLSALAADLDAAARGYQRLRSEPYAPADVSVEVFDRLWEVWPEELKQDAEKASPVDRRRLAYSRYGFIADPERPD